ncbi:MAG: aryl-sulfate sulfotransferase [Bacteroidetes bacterium]|nr:aryl-sulfate sulfotransferase [Bacteroidota bacterium]
MKVLYIILLLFTTTVYGQTLGLIQHDGNVEDGYLLYAPNKGDTVYLLDRCGRKVHVWPFNRSAGSYPYLQNDGSIIRAGTEFNPVFTNGESGGVIEKVDWEGNLVWSYQYSDNNVCQHHDIEPLPNGNVLVISYDYHTYGEAIAKGRKPELLDPTKGMWSDKIVELKPTGLNTADVVWEWRSWDHLIQDFSPTKPNYGIIKNNPQRLDINAGIPMGGLLAEDWQHMNSVTYNPGLDQIIFSVRQFNEIYVIDHSLTNTIDNSTPLDSGQLRLQNGDILYRYGNPKMYGRGTSTDQKLYFQHNAYWIPEGYPFAGEIMVFNNQRLINGKKYSSVDILKLPYDSNYNFIQKPNKTFGPDTLSWVYADTATFYSNVMANAQMLKSGHVLVNEGQPGRIFELDENKNVIWQYINPVGKDNTVYAQGQNPINNYVYKAEIIYPEHPGLAGRTLLPGESVERNPLPLPSVCNTISGINFTDKPNVSIYPNPFNNAISLSINKNVPNASMEIFDVFGRNVFVEQKNLIPSETYNIRLDLANGIYFISIVDRSTNEIIVKTKLIKN